MNAHPFKCVWHLSVTSGDLSSCFELAQGESIAKWHPTVKAPVDMPSPRSSVVPQPNTLATVSGGTCPVCSNEEAASESRGKGGDGTTEPCGNGLIQEGVVAVHEDQLMTCCKPHDHCSHHLRVEWGEERHTVPVGQFSQVNPRHHTNVGGNTKTTEIHHMFVEASLLSVAALILTGRSLDLFHSTCIVICWLLYGGTLGVTDADLLDCKLICRCHWTNLYSKKWGRALMHS